MIKVIEKEGQHSEGMIKAESFLRCFFHHVSDQIKEKDHG